MERDDQRLARRFAALAPEARRNFLVRLQDAGLSFAELPIVPAQRQDSTPVSYAQRSLWLTWLLDPASPAYNMPGLLHFNGALRVGALCAALRSLVERHETLRTTFRSADDGEPVQVVLGPEAVAVSLVDLRSQPAPARADELQRMQRDFMLAPFRLDGDPPVRATIWQLDDNEHVLGLVLHHIAADGVSIRILVDELLAFYQCECGIHADMPAPLPVQFADYALWQRNWFDAGEKDRQLAYWRNRLGEEHPPLALPFDRPGDSARPASESRQAFHLSADLSDRLRVLAREQGTSLFMVVLALFKIVLSRFSGQADVRVGAPIANRQRPETRGLVGYLTNVVVLRTQVDLSAGFSNLLESVRETVLDAHAHADLPFDMLVEALQPERHAGVHPLFQVKCTQQDDLPATRHLPGLEIRSEMLSAGEAHFDLSLDFIDRPGGIDVEFVYAEALFAQTTIGRFAQAFAALAEQVAGQPGMPLAHLDIGEPHAELRGERRSFPAPDVLDRWYESVRLYPDRLAVSDERRSLTYAELDARANAVAVELAAHGIGAEARVGIHTERNCEFVVGVLAVLKAGGVYVPLDAALPAERLVYQVRDSGALLMLSTGAPRWRPGIPVVPIDLSGGDQVVPPLPAASAHREQAAYVIYTSGSTGRPKGVVVSRGALANYVSGVLDRMDLPADAHRMAMVSTIAADLGHTVFFGALCSGRELHLLPAECVFDPDAFAAYMSSHRIDVLKIVPSHLQALLSAGRPADVLPSSRLVVGGEATSWPLLETIAQIKPGCRVLNHYGPTETTVGVLTQEAGSAVRATGSLPMGKPLPATQARVLDPNLNPVPAGVAGELYLGGAGVARGYQARAVQTAERFVASPFDAGARLYRTGDRVRMLADGSLEFLGRLDDQVKVRGYRVELGEVAQLLRAHPGVAAAEVVARADEEGRTQLQGYVVAAADSPVESGRLREALARVLPDYMVPAAIMCLDSLPLTANGKVDRKALPEPAKAGVDRYAAPEGELEQALAEIWQQVLRVDRIGRHDNFFELGGDSILTLQITTRARKRGLRFTPRALMERQTIAAVAAVATLDADKPAAAASVVAPAETGFAPIPVQAWFFEQAFEHSHHWNQSLLLSTTETVEPALLQQAVDAVVAHHEALRLRCDRAADGRWSLTVGASPESAFSQADLSAEPDPGAAITRIADRAQRSLSLQQLFHTVWMSLGSGRPGRLLLVAHHLVVDGVSWRVIVEDLEAAYRQLRDGCPAQLPPATTSLREWSAALERHAHSAGLLAELAFWRSVVRGAEPSLPGRADGSNTVADARTVTCVLSAARTRQLLQAVPQAYRTRVDEVLLTALALTLCAWDGRESVLIEVEGHGREDHLFDGIDLSRSVGWFTALYPVRLAPREAGAGPGHSLKAIKEQLRRVPHKGLGYGVLRYLGAAGRELADSAYPQVTFNYLGQFDLGQFDQRFDSGPAWRIAPESAGQERAPASRRRTWLSVDAHVADGELQVRWTHSSTVHDDSAVQGLAQNFLRELEQLIGHCLGGARGVTPSDFPLARLQQAALDDLSLSWKQVADLYPLSPMQGGMLFHSVLEPGTTAYVNQLRLDFKGLDAGRFAKAWQQAIDRHAVLRTGFLQSAQPLQWVAHTVDVPLVEHDWRDRADLAAALDAVALAERERGFDLAAPPLMRLVLVRCAAQRHHLIWTRHHLLLDGWSTAQLMAEILAAYAAHPLQPVRGRYRDYIEWLHDRDMAAAENHWRTLLAEVEEPTCLASAHRPSPDGREQLRHIHIFDAAEAARLANFARAERITVNTMVQAVWGLLLQRYTGQASVCFGATTSGRPAELADADNVLGLFINTLPVVIRHRPRQRAGDWLRELQAQNVNSREHEHTPLFDIQRWAGARNGSLFDNILVFENYPVAAALQRQGETPRISLYESREETNYPLTLTVHHGETLTIGYTYAAECFAPEQIERMAGHYAALLHALMDCPGQAVDDAQLLGEAERRQLENWGAIATRHANSQPVHRLIEQQAEVRPQATAVIFEETALTYAQLNARANRLAHHLIACGVQPETKVGIAVERSLDMVVGLLAILKAGGAYVPLDLEYPADRVAYMIEDSGIGLLLTQNAVRDRLSIRGSVKVLELDHLVLRDQPEHDPSVAVHGDNLAYVIYTSGSTGKPKGAQLCHRNVTRLLSGTESWFRFGADDVWTNFHSYAFDFSVWEIFGALCTGGQLVVVPHWISRSPEDFLRLLRRHRVTVLNQTPLAFGQLLQVPGLHDQPLALRSVIFGGEALDPQRLRPWIERCGDACPQLINMYGITETTVHVTYRRITTADLDSQRSPVGVAIPDLGLRVLDGALNAAPIGVAGELYVAGDGLARGYLDRAALTAQRFIADPFDAGGGRLYRTGDLVRWNGEGQLEYLGRIDHQLKIRGFRIELGEIEAQLLAQPDVREVIVIAKDAPTGARLVAYVCGAELDANTLRERLSHALPDYMVPSAIVVLEQLPLNANGKVDRKALPEPEFHSTQTYERPQGEIEEKLAAIWAGVLGVERVGRHDNFFELGGHSLLALTLLERMRASGMAVQVRTLFEKPELAAFAQAVAQGHERREVEVPPNLIPANCAAIEPRMLTLVELDAAQIERIEAAVPGGAANIQDIYPLAPLQEGILFHHMLQQEADAYVTAHLLSFDSRQRLEHFIAAFNRAIERHDILRTAVLWEGLPEPLQVVHRQAPLQVQWLSEIAPTVASAVGLLDACANPQRFRIDVRRAPLFHAVAAATDGQGAGQCVLKLLSHHLIDDNTTVKQLIAEIALIQHGREAELPEPVPFRRFVAQARRGVSAAEHEAFFRDMLADVDAPTAPFGLLDVQGDGSDIEEARLPLAPQLSVQIRAQAQRHGVSAAALFHLAWALVLAKTTGRNDVVFGTVLFGRMQGGDGAHRALGIFINTLPIRVRLGSRSIRQSLRETHASLTGLLHHEHASLALAQRCSGVAGGTPLFSSLLNYRYVDEPDDDMAAGSWEGMQFLGGEERSNYPVGMSVNDLGRGFQLVGQVHKSIGAQRLCETLQKAAQEIVEALAGMPDKAVSEVELLSDAERGQLRGWGVNERRYPSGEPVHRLIERQARERPNATAVICGADQLSYGELDKRANRLAHRLIAHGVQPETRVGIAVERSIDMVVGLVAIMKAGGAYVPLDPAYPAGRLAYMMDDSGIALVLTQDSVRAKLPPRESLPVLVLGALDLAGEPAHDPGIAVHAENLAYVIYTSGSTGRPKGAAIRHRSLASCMAWMQDAYGLTAADTVLHKAPFGFDVSVWEIFWPLTVGVRLVVAGPGDHRDPERIIELIRRHQVTTLNFVPAMLQAFLAHDGIETQTRLRYVICGGEAMPAPTQREALRRLRGVSLQNLYGPTETTIHVTQWSCRDDGRNTVPIGRPIAATRALVLDESLNRVLPGVAGELHIGGELLGRGYLNRAGQTAERFVADPFDDGGGRLYRTGDLVRWNSEGQLEYLGRLDHQVKIRGQRIELAEVEAQLLAQPEVREAVVTAQAGPTGSRLVGHVAAKTAHAIDPASLRERLRRQLPDYMVPSLIVVLERLPLNTNGKVDRNALPEPEFGSEGRYEAPHSEREEIMAAIWADVLGVARVGRHDNFFELGGHSLSALKVVQRMRERNVASRMGLRELFATPTIAGLCSDAFGGGRAVELCARSGDRPPLFVVHDGWGSVLDFTTLATGLADRYRVVGLPVARSDIDWDLVELARRHAATILACQPVGPYRIAGWSLGGALAPLVAAQLEADGRHVAFVGSIDPFAPGASDTAVPALRDQLVDFLGILLPRDAHAQLLADGDIRTQLERTDADPAQIAALIHVARGRVAAAGLHEYAALGDEELADMFFTACALQKAARLPCASPALAAPVAVWWSADRPAEQRARFAAWLRGSQLTQCRIDADHLAIVRTPELIAQLGSSIARVNNVEMQEA